MMVSQVNPGSEGLALKRLRFDQANGTLECLEFYLDAAAPDERVAVARAFAAAICSPEVQAGRRSIGAYRVRRLLGRGSCGTVYAAEHKRSGQPVALKVLHEQY
ncbi:MAG: hypothetical protein KC492_25410, partial [Myxococcales bacterium]|nr:hypothetical protein [Myxococcales bacterium]